jgi:hypothetical protein
VAWRRLERGSRSRSWPGSWARVAWGGFSDRSLLCSTLLHSTWLWLRPCSSRTHHLVLVRPIPAILPICAKLPDCMAANSAMRPGSSRSRPICRLSSSKWPTPAISTPMSVALVLFCGASRPPRDATRSLLGNIFGALIERVRFSPVEGAGFEHSPSRDRLVSSP